MYKRNEVKKMSEKQVQEIALKHISYCGFDCYIVEDNNGTFDEYNLFTFFRGKPIEYVAHPDYVVNVPHKLEDYVTWVEKHLKSKLYDDSDLFTFNTYREFDERRDFIVNIYCQEFDSHSYFEEGLTEEMTKNWYFAPMRWFVDKEGFETYKGARVQMYKKYKEKMEEPEFFKEACIYEMFNHESAIDWDGFEPALDALGLSYKNLSKEKQILVDEAFAYVCKHTHC